MKNFNYLYEKTMCEMTDNQKRFLAQMGSKLMDSIILDDYEIAIVTIPDVTDEMYNGVKYSLGMQKKGTEFTNVNQQFGLIPFDKIPFKEIPKFVEAVKGWVEKYGEIAVDSFNEDKLVKYERLLKRFDFKYEYRTGDFMGQERKFIVLMK